MNLIAFFLLALSLLPLSLSTPLTDSAPTPVQTNIPTQPPKTAFPGLDFTKPPELARTTPAPGDELAKPQGGGQQEIPYSQETYYTCLTRDGIHTHCGWHMPIVWVGEAGAGRTHFADKGLMVGILALAIGLVVG